MIKELKSYSFKIVAQRDKSLVLYDAENKLIEIQENGYVDMLTAKTLRETATEHIAKYDVNKLLLNRRWLGECSKDARKWIINEYYKGQKQLLNEQIELVATIKPIDSIGGIYAHLLSTNLKIFLPTVTLVDFDQEADAMGWLLDL